MDTESERVYERIMFYYLMLEHPNWSIGQHTDEMGKSPKWIRTWCSRLRAARKIT